MVKNLKYNVLRELYLRYPLKRKLLTSELFELFEYEGHWVRRKIGYGQTELEHQANYLLAVDWVFNRKDQGSWSWTVAAFNRKYARITRKNREITFGLGYAIKQDMIHRRHSAIKSMSKDELRSFKALVSLDQVNKHVKMLIDKRSFDYEGQFFT